VVVAETPIGGLTFTASSVESPRTTMLTPRRILIPATLLVVAIGLSLGGGAMFSPGELSARAGRGVRLGGVASHAELANRCSACHAPAWSAGATMADRCQNCHAEVREQLAAKQGLHGRLTSARDCAACHTEHVGPHGELTNFAHFQHDLTDFPLTGKHESLGCASCHSKGRYQGTSKTCAGCHNAPASHQQRSWSGDCASCHATTSWKQATLSGKAHAFPLDHHNRKRNLACATCHTASDQFRTYTCYGCHAHQPDKMARKHRWLMSSELVNCARCHPTGREHKDGDRRERERREKGRARDAERRDREDDPLRRELERWLKEEDRKRN